MLAHQGRKVKPVARLVLLQFDHRMPHLPPAPGARSVVPSNPTPQNFFLSYASMKTLPERLAPQSAAKSFLTVSACCRLTARFEGKPASRIL